MEFPESRGKEFVIGRPGSDVAPPPGLRTQHVRSQGQKAGEEHLPAFLCKRGEMLMGATVLFSFKVISKKGLFYIMYFLLYNPNLKSVFCGQKKKKRIYRFDRIKRISDSDCKAKNT